MLGILLGIIIFKMDEVLTVQWIWGTACNYDCSYCPDFLHNNKLEIPAHDIFLESVEYLGRLIRMEGKIPAFEFTGGEPSLLPFLSEYIKVGQGNTGAQSSLITNGSASIEWFQSIVSHYKRIEISYHPQFANFDHIVKVLDYLTTVQDLDVTVMVHMHDNDKLWRRGMAVYNKLLELGHNAKLKLLYSNFGRGTTLLAYRTWQLEQYYKSIGQPLHGSTTLNKKVETNARDKRHYIQKEDVTNESYNFFGQYCYAGINQLIVHKEGNVYRGWCKQGGPIGNVFQKNVEIPTDPIICGLNHCRNGFDRQAIKSTQHLG